MSATPDFMKTYLFSLTMKGRWDEVVDIYMKNLAIRRAPITTSGETALHVAVSDGQENTVTNMVGIVASRHDTEALRVQNHSGNTALHVAASMGSIEMCQQIANVDPYLLGIRNNYGETPLFLAALHGRKHLFLWLNYILPSADCRRDNGDTILHCAIAGDYFDAWFTDLAFQIIHLHGHLVDSVNEKGDTPLHMLASKPSAFKSGCRLGPLQKILYRCLYVEELKVEPYHETLSTVVNDEYEFQVPPNWQTWMRLFTVLRRILTVVGVDVRRQDQILHRSKHGEEDLEIQEKNDSDELSGAKRRIQLQSHSPLQLEPKFTPANYSTCFEFVKFLYLVMKFLSLVMPVTGAQGFTGLKRLRREKEKHLRSLQLMNKLLERASVYGDASMNDGGRPHFDINTENETRPYSFDGLGIAMIRNIRDQQSPSITKKDQQKEDYEKGKNLEDQKKETPILIAARNGVIEMVQKILEMFPVSIHDTDADNKNIVLLAVENRQSHVYQNLLKRKMLKESLFRNVDKKGNSVLHLAARLPDHKPGAVTYDDTAALHMQREMKWYEFVKDSVAPHYFVPYNNDNKTADEIFSETHKDLVEKGGEWMNKTSESCSVVATLIATVAFATSTAIPGGVQEKTGRPNLENHPAFMISAMSSLVALYGSVISMVMFLSILSSRHIEYDFATALPRKLMTGLTTLFVSTIAMLVSFSAGHYLSVKSKLKDAAFPIYAVASLPIVVFALSQFPSYVDVVWAIFNKAPRRSACHIRVSRA